MMTPSHAPAMMAMGFAAQHGTAHLMTAPHRHDDIEVNFVESGTLTYLFGGQRLTVVPGHFSVFWAAMPHQVVQVDEHTCFYWLTLPLSLFLQWHLPEPLVASVLAGQMLAEQHAEQAPLDRLLLQQWHADLTHQRIAAHEALCLEIEARLRRLATTVLTPLRSEHGSSIVYHHVEQMAHYIAQQYDQPLSCAQIAQSAHLHPHYAMTIFRETTGMSLMAYVTHYRLAQAQRLLVTTVWPIATIAFAVGFGSLSQFYTAFKTITPATPHAYRRSFRDHRDNTR